MASKFYLLVSNTLTGALVVNKTVVFIKDYEYTTDVLSKLYEDIVAGKVTESCVIFDLMLSSEPWSDSYVLNTVDGNNRELRSMISASDAEKLVHLFRSAGVVNCTYLSIMDVIPKVFGKPVTLLYQNSNSLFVLSYGIERNLAELTTPNTALQTMGVLSKRTGASDFVSLADINLDKVLAWNYTVVEEEYERSVTVILAIFSASELVSNDQSIDFSSLNRTESDNVVIAEPAIENADDLGNVKTIKAKGKSEKPKRMKQKRHPAPIDAVEVVGKRPRSNVILAVLTFIATILLLATAVGFAGNFILSKQYSQTVSQNAMLSNNATALSKEISALQGFAENEYSGKMFNTLIESGILDNKKIKFYNVSVEAEMIQMVVGASSKLQLTSFEKRVGNSYAILYESVNGRIVVDLDGSGDQQVTLSVSESTGDDPEYKCVIVLGEKSE